MGEWKKVEQPIAPSDFKESPAPTAVDTVATSIEIPPTVADIPPNIPLQALVEEPSSPPDEPTAHPKAESEPESKTASPQASTPDDAVVTTVHTAQAAPVAAVQRVATSSSARSSARYPHRRRTAAPLGFLVLALALVGIVSLVVSGWGMLKKALDDEPLKEELTAFLEPVMLQKPAAFSSGKQAASNASCIEAALWKVTEEEQTRMQQKKDDCRYQSDDSDRLLIPQEDVNAAFQELFGEDLSPDATLFSEKGDSFSIWYEEKAKQYHVPALTASLYQPVIDTVKKDGDTYRIRVGYVAAADIAVDDKGNDIPPSADGASVFQQYTVAKTGDRYRLTSISDV